MSPLSLIVFRLLTLSLGRSPAGSRLIRRMLLALVRHRGPGGKMAYVAHADFLDVRDLTSSGRAVSLFASETRHG